MKKTSGKHTPGPWEVHGNAVLTGGAIVQQRQIAAVIPHGRWPTPRAAGLSAEDIANAQLIAAAPDLLESARILAAFVDDYINAGCEDFDHRVTSAVRAAIAKAKGEKS